MQKRAPRVVVGNRALVIVAAAVVGGMALPGCSGSARPPASGVGSAWQRYVSAPTAADVAPVAVVRTSGDVTSASTLVGGHAGVPATLTMRAGGPLPQIVLDYGKDVGGVPSVDVRAQTGAPTLRFAFSEGLSDLGPTGDNAVPSTLSAAQSRFDDIKVTGPGVVGPGQIQGGERYELLTLTSPGSVTLQRTSIQFTALRADADAYRGWFLSSSGPLNRIWYAGAYTTQLDQVPQGILGSAPDAVATNPFPVIMDGAKRDRAVWAGDLNVSAPTVLYSTATNAYVKGSLQLLASYQNASGEMGGVVSPTAPLGTFPAAGSLPATGAVYSASYSMDVVMDMATYYRFSGDLGFVRIEWPAITRELAWNHAHVDGRGLLITTKEDGLDWDYYDGPKTGAVTAYNAIYVETLRDAADLADALGHHADATSDRAQARSVATAMNQYLWDPTLGAYAVSDTMPGTVAQDGNSMAILSGVAPKKAVPAILTALRQALWTTPYGPLPFAADTGYRADISPFSTNLEVQARFAAGDTAGALELIDRLWGHMLAPGPNDTGTFWEVFDAAGTPALGGVTSLAHGWASGPTSDLSADVLGIEPTAPGFGTWNIGPHPGSLRWAEGQVPTPRGPIHVRWDAGGKGALTLDVTAPSETHGTIDVPVPSSTATVTMNGRRVTGALVRTASDLTVMRIAVGGGGQIHVSVSL